MKYTKKSEACPIKIINLLGLLKKMKVEMELEKTTKLEQEKKPKERIRIGLTSFTSLCDCCKLCTVGCAVLVVGTMAGLNVGLGCGLGTETGVLLTGGCCFFLSESCLHRERERALVEHIIV